MASKHKTTIPARTQDPITQRELVELRVLQVELDRLTTACHSRESKIAEKVLAGAVAEPGRCSLNGTSVTVRA